MLTTMTTTAEAMVASPSTTATTGDLAASPAASVDVDDDIDDGRIDGDIAITDGEDGGSDRIAYRFRQR